MASDATGLAIVAGRGALPRLIAEDCARRGRPYRVVAFDGVPLDWTDGHPLLPAVFEKPGRLFADLRAAGCGAVTFAGGMARPELNPLRFDLTMLRLAPKVLRGLRGGDDGALRLVAEIFEAEGLRLVPAQAILTDLLAAPGVATRAKPSAADREDAARAAAIVAALGSVDVGAGRGGGAGPLPRRSSRSRAPTRCSTSSRAPAAAFRPDPAGARGVLYKAPKPGQDWRMDLPAIGPDTVRGRRRRRPRRRRGAGRRRAGARPRRDHRRRRRRRAVPLGPRGRRMRRASQPPVDNSAINTFIQQKQLPDPRNNVIRLR